MQQAVPLVKIDHGKYDILEKMHEGGMGAIYTVRHRLLDEVRVVKVLRPHLAKDQEFKARFQREARLAIQLKHPNIGRIHDFTMDTEGSGYIVMEFLDGLTLKQLIEGMGAPPLPLGLEIARQALRALGFLHSKGFVHRDISPDNFMLVEDVEARPQVKLIDLGVAKGLEGPNQLTSAGTFLGKLRYASPEHFGRRGAAAATARSDLYSFGLVFYEILTGHEAVEGRDLASLAAGHLERPPVPFSTSDPDNQVPEELREIVLRVLAKQPEDRYASTEEMANALAEIQRSYPLPKINMRQLIKQVLESRTIVRDRMAGTSTRLRFDAQFGLETTPVRHYSTDAFKTLDDTHLMAEEKAPGKAAELFGETVATGQFPAETPPAEATPAEAPAPAKQPLAFPPPLDPSLGSVAKTPNDLLSQVDATMILSAGPLSAEPLSAEPVVPVPVPPVRVPPVPGNEGGKTQVTPSPSPARPPKRVAPTPAPAAPTPIAESAKTYVSPPPPPRPAALLDKPVVSVRTPAPPPPVKEEAKAYERPPLQGSAGSPVRPAPLTSTPWAPAQARESLRKPYDNLVAEKRPVVKSRRSWSNQLFDAWGDLPKTQKVVVIGGPVLILVLMMIGLGLMQIPDLGFGNATSTGGSTASVPPPPPRTPMAQDPPGTEFHPELISAQESIDAGDYGAAWSSLDLLAQEGASLALEERRLRDQLMQALGTLAPRDASGPGGRVGGSIVSGGNDIGGSETGVTPKTVTADVKRALERGDIKLLTDTVDAVDEIRRNNPTAFQAVEPGLLPRARDIVSFGRQMWSANRNKDYAELLRVTTELVERFPRYQTASVLREEAASRIEEEAAALAAEGRVADARKLLGKLQTGWRDRPGLKAKIQALDAR